MRMYVYEAEMETGIPGYRSLIHVNAADEASARERVREKRGAQPIKSLSVRRELAEHEIVARGLKVEN